MASIDFSRVVPRRTRELTASMMHRGRGEIYHGGTGRASRVSTSIGARSSAVAVDAAPVASAAALRYTHGLKSTTHRLGRSSPAHDASCRQSFTHISGNSYFSDARRNSVRPTSTLNGILIHPAV